MKRSDIVTICIAIYGAVLSTVMMVRQLFSDRIRIKLMLKRGMEIIGHPAYAGMSLTILEVTNFGRRPVTIVGAGGVRLFPAKSFTATDTLPPLPCEISEGKYITVIIDESDMGAAAIDYWQARDSRGKTHKLREASLIKHWVSACQRRLKR